MRFFEIAGGRPDILATAEFDKEIRFFMKGYPACLDKLKAFLDFRLTARPEQGFNSKDYPYRPGTPLAGWRHVHLIFGKVVVTYQMSDGEIRLCIATHHDPPAQALSQFLNGLTPNDFHPFVMPTKPGAEAARRLSADDRKEIVDLFYEMSAQDRDILQLAAQGQLAELMEFVDLMLENGWTKAQKQQGLVELFGGQDGLAEAIQQVLKSTAVRR